MSTTTTTLSNCCVRCESHLIRIHMKNPFIDDFTDECPTCEPGEALSRLHSWARSAARQEYAEEKEHLERETEEEYE